MSLKSVVFAQYLGETCPFCMEKFSHPRDLEDAIWCPTTKYGRIAHGGCWNNMASTLIVEYLRREGLLEE